MSQYITNANAKDLWVIEDKDFALAQALYHKITQRTESSVKIYDEEYIIHYEDISQLYQKLLQQIQQWKTLGNSCEITVKFDDDSSQKFSSFERFSLFDKSISAVVVEVVVKFTFLLQANLSLADTEKQITPLQNYTTTVKLLNRNAIYTQDKIPRIFTRKMIVRPSIILEIDYVDYMIALNITSCVDSWVRSLEQKSKPMKCISIIQEISYSMDTIFQILFPSISGFLLIKVLENISTSDKLLSLFVLAILVLFLSFKFGDILGTKLGEYVSSVGNYSELLFTKGDENLLKKLKKEKGKSIAKSILIFLGSILLNIFLNILSAVIIEKFFK